jgi:ATP-dependent helicase HepA
MMRACGLPSAPFDFDDEHAMANPIYIPGQRYHSSAEPELGLGTVMRTEGRVVQVVFTLSGVIRQYAQASAPLIRAEFKVGDTVLRDGKKFEIKEVLEQKGLRYYVANDSDEGKEDAFTEGELDDQQAAGDADERLIAGRVDTNLRYGLRVEALERRAKLRSSVANGLYSAKISLLRHQLQAVDLALKQPEPRMLLADEVGLGKTIEAGLILTRLLASGRISRVLIVVPEALVYQWFIELMRRFNLKTAIFDEERAESIELTGEGRNPFQDDQIILTDLAFLSGSAKRAKQIADAGWDMMIVDEAHHLQWSVDNASMEYQAVETIALATPSVLLLTATPEQLGLAGHFARLRLLDPARYSDFAQFEKEASGYQAISKLAEQLQSDESLSDKTIKKLSTVLAEDAVLVAKIKADADDKVRTELLDALIDRHGTGRVMVRNRRVSVGGFPARELHAERLDSAHEEALRERLLFEFKRDVGLSPLPIAEKTEVLADQSNPDILALTHDPRFVWLLTLLDQYASAKFVLICRHSYKVQQLESALRLRSGIKVSRFTEHLTLAQRDRNAAYFADPEGARLLLCSEIGSEGRNFQFAHHLILWDLPLDPDLLEQRIGRLDRIGQTENIKIHSVVLKDSAQSLLLDWHEKGVGGFAQSPADGRELFRRFGERLIQTALHLAKGDANSHAQAKALIDETHQLHAEFAARIHDGRDRLLELAAQRGAGGLALAHAMNQEDQDSSADDFCIRLFENYGVDTEELRPRTWRLDPEMISNNDFTALGQEPSTISFDRSFALERDEVPLMHIDHPSVQTAIELLLGSDEGNAACIVDPDLPPSLAMLECVFVMECICDRKLDADRYLPPEPIRLVLDTKLQTRDWRPSDRAVKRADEQQLNLAPLKRILTQLIPEMVKGARAAAEPIALAKAQAAVGFAEEEIQAELARLKALKKLNASVRESELDALQKRLSGLQQALPTARLRLDALRLAVNPSFLKLR